MDPKFNFGGTFVKLGGKRFLEDLTVFLAYFVIFVRIERWKKCWKYSLKKKLQKHIQKPTKIHQKTVPVATKMESRKQSANMYQKIRGNCWKWTPKWEPIFGHILAIWPFFAVPGKPWEPNWLPRPSQESPGPVQASIFIDFRWIWVDFVMIFRVMWATFCLVCLVSFVGLLNHFWWFIASPTFQISGHRFIFLAVKPAIHMQLPETFPNSIYLRSPIMARWREGRRQVDT